MNSRYIGDELSLQREIYSLLNNTKQFESECGKFISILSRGKLNRLSGPDYREMVVLIDGKLSVCDGEVHINAADWFNHLHHSDPSYSKVKLHFVINGGNKEIPGLVNINITEPLSNPTKSTNYKKHDEPYNYEIQELALLRLKRKSSFAKNILNIHGIELGIRILLSSFLNRYASSLQKFPANKKHLNKIPNDLLFPVIDFVRSCSTYNIKPGKVNEYFRKNFSSCGISLSQEIFINVTFPSSIAIANQNNISQLMTWYWSEKAFQSYGKIRRRFGTFAQEYIWQQQGLLEYIRTYSNNLITSEPIMEYIAA